MMWIRIRNTGTVQYTVEICVSVVQYAMFFYGTYETGFVKKTEVRSWTAFLCKFLSFLCSDSICEELIIIFLNIFFGDPECSATALLVSSVSGF